jgi:uncharacterized membrane protein
MVKKLASCAVVLVILAHLGFMIAEMTLWASAFGRESTHLSLPAARETVGVGINMGLYNGFLAFLLFWATFALRESESYSAQRVLLSLIVVAGVVGAVTMRNPLILAFQSLPALAAVGLVWLARPFARTEQEATRQIIQVERQILAIKTVEPGEIPGTARGAVPRGQHPKLLGLLEARFVVERGLPDDLAVGIFREPGRSYDAWVRFSNARNLRDDRPGGHGMAIQLRGVGDAAGAGGSGQDFILFDAPAFFVGSPTDYAVFEEASLRAFGKSRFPTLISVFLNYYWCRPGQLRNLLKAQRGDVIDPLAVRYWSVTPYRLGEAAVKYAATPVGACATAAVVERSGDMFRRAMKAHLGRADVDVLEFEFQVQRQADHKSMPTEDPTRPWDEGISPFETVARLRIPTGQAFDTEDRDRFAEGLTFTPWHALPEHEPLGGINRVRRAVYESLSEFRHALSRVPREGCGGRG